MAIDTMGPANKKSGTQTGDAPHPRPTKQGFDSATQYADFSKSKVGIGADKKKG